MGLWQIDADTLARSRFVVSPLAETIASLISLSRGTGTYDADRAWLATHRSALRTRLAADPVAAALVEVSLGRRWIADYLTPPPDDQPSIVAELAVVAATPGAAARANLEVCLQGALPPVLDRDDLGQRSAELLQWVWTRAVLPDWQRRRRLLEADVLARTARLGSDGWAAALDRMRPNMRWLGDGRLQINAQDYPPRQVLGAQLMFVPVSRRHGWVTADVHDRFGIVYPASGTLTDGVRAAPSSVSRLLGRARAEVLVLLDAPKSTTQLVALTGQQLGSVGGHLKVLLDSGLVARRRAGRSVLYYRTAAGEVLLRAGRISTESYPPPEP